MNFGWLLLNFGLLNPSVGWLLLPVAWLVDRILGDPRWLPHPVVYIGKFIAWFEGFFYPRAKGPMGRKGLGLLLLGATLTVTAAGYVALAFLLSFLPGWLALLFGAFFLSQALATKGLADAALEIHALLEKGDLVEARRKVGWIVGRDTVNLTEAEVVRATVETVAENAVDGIVAPLVYGAAGGLVGAWLYKAVNTLDSMVGYKNERYREFGWASARLDDGANYLPARLAVPIFLLIIALRGHSAGNAWRTLLADARKHPSPNSGIAEALVAGALGIQLGGLNYYGGLPSQRATMGQPTRPLEREDILRTVAIVEGVSFLTALAATGVIWSMTIFLRG